jgi:hypothetical protein
MSSGPLFLGGVSLRASVMALALASAIVAQQGIASQEAILSAPDAAAGDYFGQSVAISGETALVGAYATNNGSGSAYVYVRTGTDWSLQSVLTANDLADYAYFGYSVALSGDTAVVGALDGDTISGADAGAAYVFTRSGTTWAQTAKLVPADAAPKNYFGISVAISGSSILVGAYQYTVGPGAAYVFVRHGASWTQQSKLIASDGVLDDWFGVAVDIDGDSAVVGAQSTHGPGAAYVYQRNGIAWTQQAKLTGSPIYSGANFGGAVSIEADIIVVGALADVADGVQAGSAFVFKRAGTIWTQDAKLIASDPTDNAYFGRPVCLSGNTLAIGAIEADSLGGDASGAGYVFSDATGHWVQQFKLTGTDSATNDLLGSGISVDADTVIVGAPGHNHGVMTNVGDSLVFRLLTAGSWTGLAGGVAGYSGMPTLEGAGMLLPGTMVTLNLNQARPFAPAPLIVGLTMIAASFKGGILIPSPDFVFPLFSDFFGSATFGGLWPAGVPSGFTTYFQWWIQDPAGPKGYAASNALAATTP